MWETGQGTEVSGFCGVPDTCCIAQWQCPLDKARPLRGRLTVLLRKTDSRYREPKFPLRFSFSKDGPEAAKPSDPAEET